MKQDGSWLKIQGPKEREKKIDKQRLRKKKRKVFKKNDTQCESNIKTAVDKTSELINR